MLGDGILEGVTGVRVGVDWLIQPDNLAVQVNDWRKQVTHWPLQLTTPAFQKPTGTSPLPTSLFQSMTEAFSCKLG